MESETYYIYGIFNDLTNELVYVGSTKYIEARYKAHLSGLASSFKKHCRIEILDETRYCRDEYESYWINMMFALGCNLLNKCRKPYNFWSYTNGKGDLELTRKIQHIRWREEYRLEESKKNDRSLSRKMKCKICDIMKGWGHGI